MIYDDMMVCINNEQLCAASFSKKTLPLPSSKNPKRTKYKL